ncbi:MAG TPA: Lrp/AsnC family transcriptional regulator [Actinocrinis sp.]|uniref:Lrp/AsnC family transcriptional regulator n=1 Tax=Actinocrinis sp. TaxID=1920516 RepID=UPI002DDD51D5|nr:Lrp/AsnC family transcriptional regulator [Actinocrinis sp.]HEV2343536.1 Lrp/AsnC family transcriptional regulator [Actinocrinis sp.]
MRTDETDERIIGCLLRDARSAYADIGAQVGLSAPAVKRRVDRLRAEGLITGFTALVDPVALGWTTEAFVELYCTGRTSPDAIRTAMSENPEIVAAYTVTGEADALLHLRTRGTAHLETVLERVRTAPFVQQTKSVLVLSRLIDRR